MNGAGYGSTAGEGGVGQGLAKPLQRGGTQAIRDEGSGAKTVLVAFGWCVILPMLIFGFAITVLSKTVPRSCTTNLHSVFLGLGFVYILTSVVSGCIFGCCGSAIVDALIHQRVAEKHTAEERDEEAQREAEQ